MACVFFFLLTCFLSRVDCTISYFQNVDQLHFHMTYFCLITDINCTLCVYIHVYIYIGVHRILRKIFGIMIPGHRVETLAWEDV